MKTSIYNLFINLYRIKRDGIIGSYYSTLRSLSSTTPSPLNLDDVKKVLVVAPHPDDDVLGCGGTLFVLKERGYYGETIFLTNGKKSGAVESDEISTTRRNEALKGSEKLGIKKSHFLGYHDFRLKPDKNAVNFVLSRLNEIKPDMVFTPFFMENHSDHRATAKILALAANQYNGDFLCCCYELWSTLIPNYIVDITPFMERKISAIKCHESQTNETDLIDLARGLNRYRAIVSGQPFQYAEAFFAVSKKKYISLSAQFKK
ncbi:MAG: hypothetical protein CMD96_06960 [Gammaproteobacteria bacterium]|nr:hypothetical protein [Gammaproteobacteria bacterium]HJP17142.1 PIG-L deacetylase family protein [Nitrospinota bacterium]